MAIPSTVAQLGRYMLRTRLASGKACDVWLAEIDGRNAGTPPVVFKKLIPELAQQPLIRERFITRCLRAQALISDKVAQTLEVVQSGDDVGVATEHVDGKSLRQLITAVGVAGNALPVWFAIHVARCVCDGLEQAHELLDSQKKRAPLLHQSLRPENIFLTYNGCVKITDFGIGSRALQRGPDDLRSSLRMPIVDIPSQTHESASDDEQVDLAALGYTLYELLAGVCPHVSEEQRLEFVPPSHHARWVGVEVDEILRKLLSPSSPEHIRTPGELRQELDAYLTQRRHEVSSSHTSGLITLLFGGECRDSAPPTRRFDDGAVYLARLRSRRTSPPEDNGPIGFEHAAPTRPGIPTTTTLAHASPTLPSPPERIEAPAPSVATSEASLDSSDSTRTASPFRHDWDLAIKRAREQSPFGGRSSGTFPATKPVELLPPLDPIEQANLEFDQGLEAHKRGELQAALAAWERALALDPQHRVCRANLNLLKKKLNLA